MIRRKRIQVKPNVAKAAKSAVAPTPSSPVETPPITEEPTPIIEQDTIIPEDPVQPEEHIFTEPQLTSPQIKEVHHVHFEMPPTPSHEDIQENNHNHHNHVNHHKSTPRSRNVSLCEDEAILQAKTQKEKKRFTGKEELDTKSWKISDLARWNPKHEGAIFRRERRTSTSSTIITKSEINAESQPATPAVNAPQVKIGADGKLVIDESSLVVQTVNNDSVWETVEEGRNSSKINSMSFRNRIFRKSTPWCDKETELFYDVLRCTGTDFGLMHHFLPQRTRQELKAKYNREEKSNWHRISNASRLPSTLDDSLKGKVQQVLNEMEDEEREKKEKKEFEKEEERRIRQEAKDLKQQERSLEIQKRMEVRQLLIDAKAKIREAKQLEKDKRDEDRKEKLKELEVARQAEKERKEKQSQDKMDRVKQQDEARQKIMEAKKLIQEARNQERLEKRKIKEQLDAEKDDLEREAERIIRRLIKNDRKKKLHELAKKRAMELGLAGDQSSTSQQSESQQQEDIPSTSLALPSHDIDYLNGSSSSSSSSSSSPSEDDDEEAFEERTAKRERQRMEDEPREKVERRKTNIKPLYVTISKKLIKVQPIVETEKLKETVELAKNNGALFDSADDSDDWASAPPNKKTKIEDSEEAVIPVVAEPPQKTTEVVKPSEPPKRRMVKKPNISKANCQKS